MSEEIEMDNRRGFVGKLLAALGLASAGASVKAISAEPDKGTVYVLTLRPEHACPPDDFMERVERTLESRLGDRRVIVLSHGTTFKAVPGVGCYHHERLGDYEIEVVAPTEKELRERLKELWGQMYYDPTDAPAEPLSPNEVRELRGRAPYDPTDDPMRKE